MKKCDVCASEMEDTAVCCPVCGARQIKSDITEKDYTPFSASAPLPEYVHVPTEEEIADSKVTVKDTMSLRDYVLMYLVTLVPIINVFMLCVWIFGNEAGISKKNFAKYMVVIAAAKFILFLIVVFIFNKLISGVMAGVI